LRRVYRDLLRRDRPAVRFCHLVADQDDIQRRLDVRTGHYMPASLLPSQFATLEPLEPDEPGVAVDECADAADTIRAALRLLGLAGRHDGAPSEA
jgi:gluconokinase